jgi:hypothetical protein
VLPAIRKETQQREHRGLFRFTGLPLVTLAVAAAVCDTNVRQLRNWHQRTGHGHPADPLLVAEPAFHGYVLLPGPAQPADADATGALPAAA